MKKRIIIFALSLIFIFSSAAASFAGGTDYAAIKNEIAEALLDNENKSSIQAVIDSSFSKSPANGEELYILALRQCMPGELNYDIYREALEAHLSETKIASATTRLREALLLFSLGSNSAYIKDTLEDSTGKLGVMSWVFALHLLNNGIEGSFSKDEIINTVLSMETPVGGWSLNAEQTDVDVTAMTIQALAPHYNSDEAVKAAVDRAISALSQLQLDNGGYKLWGYENPESPAQVILALSCLGTDPLTDERFIKNGNTLLDAVESFRLDDGRFSHTYGGEYNKTATNQVFFSLSGYEMMLEGKGSIYLFGSLIQKDRSLIEDIEDEQPAKNSGINFKTAAYIGLAAILIIWIILLAVKGKKNIKSYVSAVLVIAIIAGGVSFIKIESKEAYYTTEDIEEKIITTTISINCNTVAGREEYIPDNGEILLLETVEVPEGSTAYDQLDAACRLYGIQKESASGYVSGIANLYEYQFGDLSGWMFKINGDFADCSCASYKLVSGDYIEWVYTTDLGRDVGQEIAE